MAAFDKIQPLLAHAARHRDADLSLEALARKAGVSPFHLHRVFSQVTGETPKQLTLRLRLELAAVLLLTTDKHILPIALDCGFQSHETFTRAFRAHFGLAPRAYRERGFTAPADPSQHADAVLQTGPCIGLYRMPTEPKEPPMSYTISKRDLAEQPVLFVRRRVAPSAIATAITETLPLIFAFAQKKGIAFNGHPITRYTGMEPGMMSIEPSMRIAGPATITEGEGEVMLGTLPAGPAAVTTHMGPYDKLGDAYTAIQQWMEAEGLRPAGAPWEDYVTDPAEDADPANWRTDVYWPVA